MLLKKFYTILKKEDLKDGLANWQIELNPKHEVFEGHFPETQLSLAFP